MTDVDTYIANIDPGLRGLAEKVRSIGKRALPSAVESIKMGVPNYSINGKSVACIADYSKHINLYFFSGSKLSSKLLEGTGKGMRHIKIRMPTDIKDAEFTRLLRQTAKLMKSGHPGKQIA